MGLHGPYALWFTTGATPTNTIGPFYYLYQLRLTMCSCLWHCLQTLLSGRALLSLGSSKQLVVDMSRERQVELLRLLIHSFPLDGVTLLLSIGVYISTDSTNVTPNFCPQGTSVYVRGLHIPCYEARHIHHDAYVHTRICTSRCMANLTLSLQGRTGSREPDCYSFCWEYYHI